MRDVIVEVRGGVLVEIYSDDPHTRMVVVDWDRIADDEDGTPGFEWEPCKLGSMPEDTRAEYTKAGDSSDDYIIGHLEKK